MAYCLGIDIGGTKTTVCVADEHLNPLESKTFPTEAQLGAEDLVQRIALEYDRLCCKLAIKKSQVSFAGVASPGPLDIKTGRIIYIATMGFRNVPIKQMLEAALGLPVFLENDANCAALAESVMGIGRGADPLVYVTISTGVGCGIIVNGRILSGACSCAGEIGHMTVEPEGKKCDCGKNGCLELYSSGTAIANTAFTLTGVSMTAKEVFSRARAGDEAMLQIIADAADKLGLALSSVYHLIDPEIIVLGGSVTKDYEVFSEYLSNALSKYTQPVKNRNINIKISEFDGQQVVLGALVYAKQNFMSIVT